VIGKGEGGGFVAGSAREVGLVGVAEVRLSSGRCGWLLDQGRRRIGCWWWLLAEMIARGRRNGRASNLRSRTLTTTLAQSTARGNHYAALLLAGRPTACLAAGVQPHVSRGGRWADGRRW
jgi:hypothetical protein